MKEIEESNKRIQKFTGDEFTDIIFDCILNNKQVIVFVNSKKRAEAVAERLAKSIIKTKNKFNFSIDEKGVEDISSKILNTLSHQTKQCERLSYCAKQSVSFHHAGLAPKQRETIEEGFLDGKIRVICATPTLAYGLNLPAYRVVVLDLKRFGHRGMDWIPILEYLQMSGRAGRPGKDDKGESIIIAKDVNEKMKIVDKYILGEPEEILSKLAVEPALRTYLLSLISLKFITTKEQMLSFFEKTFWAHQFGDMEKLESILEKMLKLLIDFDFIDLKNKKDKLNDESKSEINPNKKDSFFTSALNLRKKSSENENTNPNRIKSTLLGDRVSQLYLDPLTGNHIIKTINKIYEIADKSKKEKISTFGLLHSLVNNLEMWPLSRVKVKEYDIYDEIVFKETFIDWVPTQFMPEYDDFINSVKTTCALYDWIEELNEEYLLEKYDMRPGELKVKLDNLGWLIYSMQELARNLDDKTKLNFILKETEKLKLRLKYGVKEELLSLLRLKGIGRVKARKMFNHGIKTISDIKSSKELGRLIGEKTAEKIKKQIE